jgi:6-phosphogluconate dehydrogenase
MKIGFVGLGKMGFSLVGQLLGRGHDVVVFDLFSEPVRTLASRGALSAVSLQHLVEQLPLPRIVWMMVPAGSPVDEVLEGLVPFLRADDILLDGGNSRYTDSITRAKQLQEHGVRYLDVGTSGGLEGARHGACLMVGGDRDAYDAVEPLFRDVCVEGGYAYMGASGTGHFVKMVHNGIEYGMMQAIGEGFDILESSGYELDHRTIADVWSHGSVIRGWLMELAGRSFQKDAGLGYLSGEIADSGEGRWAVETALDLGVSIPVIAEAVFRRFRSRSRDNFSDRVVAALRHEFGGHGFRQRGAEEDDHGTEPG